MAFLTSPLLKKGMIKHNLFQKSNTGKTAINLTLSHTFKHKQHSQGKHYSSTAKMLRAHITIKFCIIFKY